MIRCTDSINQPFHQIISTSERKNYNTFKGHNLVKIDKEVMIEEEMIQMDTKTLINKGVLIKGEMTQTDTKILIDKEKTKDRTTTIINEEQAIIKNKERTEGRKGKESNQAITSIDKIDPLSLDKVEKKYFITKEKLIKNKFRSSRREILTSMISLSQLAKFTKDRKYFNLGDRIKLH